MSEPDPKRVLILFTEWLAHEDILPRITEQECADIGQAFLAGYMLGRADTLATTAHGGSRRPAADRTASHGARPGAA